ncbi:Uncharacterised protein [Actinomadura madurae]|nr:Uncharacterised protein [Actinomadura madurae]
MRLKDGVAIVTGAGGGIGAAVKTLFTEERVAVYGVDIDPKGDRVGAVVEPTSVAFHGMFLRAGGFRPGDHVAVFGCGPVGLAAVGPARACGARRRVSRGHRTAPGRAHGHVRPGGSCSPMDSRIDRLAARRDAKILRYPNGTPGAHR